MHAQYIIKQQELYQATNKIIHISDLMEHIVLYEVCTQLEIGAKIHKYLIILVSAVLVYRL